ncbi:MAG: cytochrome b/b6 domain-containing protein, partial [Candidatus Latescibacteria bacterium]|nr:cytochrome b/b6 domain-containing protein [Candidatus Latescibacterota bacterium]
PYRLYTHGVHGIALSRGMTDAASCNDCHGSHRLQSANDPTSPIFRQNIPSTCSKCHNEVYQTYETGIHGQAVVAGNRDAPVCIDCHGEHEIIPPSDPASPVSPRNISTTCSACHEDVRLTERYGIPARRLVTYMDTYHGLANKAGVPVVANCASCHGAHDILPSSDPRSSINKANIPATCGKCHPNAGVNFAKGSVHLTPVEKEGRIIDYVKRFYILLIVVTIGGMCLHNGLDFLRRLKDDYHRRKIHREEGDEEAGEDRRYLRWTLGERIQHWILAVSFITLAITGFALKYPEAFWVAPLIKNGQAMDWRGIVHRIAAVIFIALSLYHVGYIVFTRRGREQLKAMMWRRSDLREVRQMLLVNTGLEKEPPAFDRFTYTEKSEYWALIWGGIVMGVTGLLLWFENTAMTYLPKWLLDVATVVHLYEAWLATLAIVVWHFYAVIFNPQVYPLNWSMMTGWLTEKEMAEEHPGEHKRLRDSDG